GCTRTIWGEGESVSLIPLGPDRLGVMIYQDTRHPTPPPSSDPVVWRAYLARLYANYPREVKDSMAALKEGDEVFADEILMVPAQRLAKGRLALLGDAGYCPTFFSGMGAAAALLGAYALSRQLARHDDPTLALAEYEARLVPLARGYQASALS